MANAIRRFQNDKNWKTKFRLVLLIPLAIVLFYIASNVPLSESPTGRAIGTPETPQANNEYLIVATPENQDDSGFNRPANENETVSSRTEDLGNDGYSFSGSSSTPTSVARESKKDTQKDAEKVCDSAPATEILVSVSSGPPIPPLLVWGNVSVYGKPAKDWLEVKAVINGTDISKTKTCKESYVIKIPGGEGKDITFFIDGKNAGTFSASSGPQSVDLAI